MHGDRLVGAVISAARCERVTNVDPIPDDVLGKIYAEKDDEFDELERHRCKLLSGGLKAIPAKRKRGKFSLKAHFEAVLKKKPVKPVD